MAQYQFPIHVDDHTRARKVAGKAHSLSAVYQAAFRIGRSVWEATRPDRKGEKPPRVTPSENAYIPHGWSTWPDDVCWAPSACARWCVHVGIGFVEVYMPRTAIQPPPGVLMAPSAGRIVYPLALAEKVTGEQQIAAYADSLGFAIEWESEIRSTFHASSAVYRIPVTSGAPK